MPGMTRSLLQGEIHSKPKVQNGNLMIKFGMESYDKSQLWVLEKETFCLKIIHYFDIFWRLHDVKHIIPY